MHVTRQRICLWAVALLAFSAGCHAQSVTPEQEYQKLIHVDQDIQPLGEHPFGENISLYNGSLSFDVTDTALRGNGPTIDVGRTLSFWQSPGDMNAGRPFGDWDLNIPRIETLVAGPGVASTAIWQTGVAGSSTTGTTRRCSNFTMPPVIAPGLPDASGWMPDEWWFGYKLLVPGQGSQLLMPRGTDNALSPTMSGMSFPIVTKNNWMIGCGVTASDGGEGFLAVAPDGTRYTFSHLVYRVASELTKGSGQLPPDVASPAEASTLSSPTPAVGGGVSVLFRRDAFMYVTQIQDRFGNTLTYNYDPSTGYLTSIVASDGREVDLAYVSGSALVHTVTAKAANTLPRTWTYSYDTSTATLPTLTGVQRPDGSAWSYHVGFIQDLPVVMQGSNCQEKLVPTIAPPSSSTETTGTMTAPSGLTAMFTVSEKLSGRSYVPQDCYGLSSDGTAPESVYPEWSVQYALVSEVLSGAGMPTQTWNYTYSPANESWTNDPCATSGTCATTVYTDVTDPNGNATRYTFSNRFDATEGQLLRTDAYNGAVSGAPIRTVTNLYASPTSGPWPTSYGTDLLYRNNHQQTQEAAPLQQTTLSQGGDTYTRLESNFNAYLQPRDLKRYNSISGQASIEETTSYYNDTALWVLGLPLQVTNVGTGEIESSNTYDTSNDTLQSRARFGQTLMSYTYQPNGNLASFTDGNGHTTALNNYYRGVPRLIGYPDGTSESLAVDDFGQVTGITDQAGATTTYSYDQVGRLKSITYPTGDEQAWYPKTFTYDYVTAAERGIAANHWRRTVAKGNEREVTYFDSELRPILSDTYSTASTSSHTSARTDYDFRGQATFSSYPAAGSPNLSSLTAGTTRTYDALGRLTQSQQSSELGTLTATTAYLSGNRMQVTDPKGNVTTTSYQVFDEPSYDAVTQVLAPTGLTQTIQRDVYGNPLALTQGGAYNGSNVSVTKTLTYDAYHRLCRTTEPESGNTVMAYDAANNLAWSASGVTITGSGCGQDQVAAAGQTVRTYDAMNRVHTLVPPSGTQSTTYGYDALGNVKSAVSGISTWTATRNKLGELTGETLQLSGQSAWTLGYTHDAYGNLSALRYPTGEIVNYTPDALGRPSQAGSYLHGVGYFPNGEVASYTIGNGATYLAEQNARQLTSNFSYGLGSTLNISEDLVYDADGNITAVNDLTGTLRNKLFSYDALNRLTRAQANNLWGTETYAYDPLNNIRTRVGNGQTFSYAYDGTNRLTSISGVGSYGYDARGNQTSRSGSTLTYDQKNQLTSVSGHDSYAYDAFGRRVMKTVSGGKPSYYFYDQAGQLVYRWDTGTSTSTSFIYLGNKLIARSVYAGSTHSSAWYYNDLQGTTLASADPTGTIAASYDYRPYGVAAMGSTGPFFAGHNLGDTDVGLVYMQARYYDPGRGGFLSVDPVSPAPGNLFNFNRYEYTNNNPINHTDSDGRCVDGLTCDQMVQSYGKWAAANPAQADKIGSAVGVPGVTGMLVASGLGEVVGVVKAAIAVDKALSDSPKTELVQRAMSKAELKATHDSGLVRGGRSGTHYASDAVNSSAGRAQQRLALPTKPEVRVTLKVPVGRFSTPSPVEPNFNMPGGGMERTATGDVPATVVRTDTMQQ